ncbi:Uma2 family endonuclease [Dactylosporangium aurantiacum]|uniref:Uma2 family endonuclease n=1 Tax=Dactylosporangium aurantiacum TaxID=35754 RepID=A0A9Q9MHU5_9ACTN|nr:Uma2 family endonuclease [Dactylosporangium aurantiacum]MDG6105524.1 Uma2 family endonuclease [Dactylosporangium aurantiacum]UWZ57129.1 Uma2 family endonuclease [Dactylosporangium aurantiacum]
MPTTITLDDVAAMADADEHHRYELSREGVLSIMPPAQPEHALTVAKLVHWFYANGFGPEQVTTDCGIDVGGGRQPDVTVWAKGKPPRPARSSYAGLDGLLLAVEVVSPDSERIDRIIKRDEYAAAGVPRYWIIGRDAATTVHALVMHDGEFVAEEEPRPLVRLLSGPVPNLG